MPCDVVCADLLDPKARLLGGGAGQALSLIRASEAEADGQQACLRARYVDSVCAFGTWFQRRPDGVCGDYQCVVCDKAGLVTHC